MLFRSSTGYYCTPAFVVCANYLSMAKSDHKRDGITYETAKANGFLQAGDVSENSPPI